MSKAQFEDYIEEIKQKTFSATSLDKKKASTKNTATASWTAILRVRASDGAVRTCRELIILDFA